MRSSAWARAPRRSAPGPAYGRSTSRGRRRARYEPRRRSSTCTGSSRAATAAESTSRRVVTGGVVEFRLDVARAPQIGSVRLPNSVGFAGIFAGRSASTPALVAHFRAFQAVGRRGGGARPPLERDGGGRVCGRTWGCGRSVRRSDRGLRPRPCESRGSDRCGYRHGRASSDRRACAAVWGRLQGQRRRRRRSRSRVRARRRGARGLQDIGRRSRDFE